MGGHVCPDLLSVRRLGDTVYTHQCTRTHVHTHVHAEARVYTCIHTRTHTPIAHRIWHRDIETHKIRPKALPHTKAGWTSACRCAQRVSLLCVPTCALAHSHTQARRRRTTREKRPGQDLFLQEQAGRPSWLCAGGSCFRQRQAEASPRGLLAVGSPVQPSAECEVSRMGLKHTDSPRLGEHISLPASCFPS